ncbi:DUF4189 domain-containing protein [Paroceanicella profunda]|uniref:DUF4189 domain-containing protein n=1 Tax=Paroceanicella profunda TaxID=2579971 RepID=A0A5B8FQJ7_9RHOB|nr:DUF4189 domain-containing protein [Paroceanicella profunda]QDL90926.1 DUF4189 domain-containing protein [Paroceanicella profunda]
MLSQQFDASLLPYVSDKTRASLTQSWETLDADQRARFFIAVSPKGPFGSSWAGASSASTDADLQRIALQKCEQYSRGACGLAVSKGRNIAYAETPRTLSYPTTLDTAEIPFLNTKQRGQLGLEYTARPFAALALSRTGFYGYVTGRSSEAAARREAMSLCEGTPKERTCFIYSVGTKVVFGPDTKIY